MLIFCALHQTFMPQKASQKLGIDCKQDSIGPKPAYAIDPCSYSIHFFYKRD